MKPIMAAIILSGTLSTITVAQSPVPPLIGHRGASHAAPENTIASMELAWKEGADGVEGDFHLTKDGEVVCMHDYDTLRTTGVKKIIKETPWSELETLDAGSWKSPDYRGEKIPRFAEMLDHLPAGKSFFVEIKSGPATIAPVKAVLDSHKGKFDPKAIFIISFDAKAVAEARRLMPEIQAHLITQLKEWGDAAGMRKLDKTLVRSGATGLQFKYLPTVTGEWIQSLKGRGLLTDCWVVDDAGQAAELIKSGIGYITTDRPGPLRAELKTNEPTR